MRLLPHGNDELVFPDPNPKACLIYIIYIVGNDALLVDYLLELLEVFLYYVEVLGGGAVRVKRFLEPLEVVVAFNEACSLSAADAGFQISRRGSRSQRR
jgi:hypothetical protein